MTDNRVVKIPGDHRNIVDLHQDQIIDENATSSKEKGNSNEFDSLEELPGKKKDKKSVEAVGFRSLFRYAARIDIIYMLIGTIGGLCNGVLLPLMVLVFGGLLNSFTSRSTDLCTLNYTAISIQSCPAGYQLTASNFLSSLSICNLNITLDFQNQIKQQTNYLVILGCVSIVMGYLQVAFWSIAAEKQTKTIRKKLFQSILRKDMVYFDLHKAGELNTKLTDDVNKIHDGIGDKLGATAQFLSAFITGFCLGFAKGWKLTLVILSISPLLFTSAVLFSRLASSLTAMELKAYGKAGAIAEEVLSSIRTVFAYNGQIREQKRYEKYLGDAKKNGIKKGGINGFTMGTVWFLIYCAYALGFWYGAKLIREEGYSIGDVIIVFFSIIIAIFNLGQASPHFQALTQARGAAYAVWKIIDDPSKIHSDSETGLKKASLTGDIRFSNVHFTYPSRLGVKILDGISFDVKRGQTIALVGSSGSGKSTCVQLLQRFYDPDAGSVFIDDHQVDEYNLKWLREHIGVVSQEPILFQATIRENILFGRDTATDAEVHEAAKMANAHNFIMDLPDKYETRVGDRGATLSGGQKQRIAIARALIRDPKILLLDEATSALDNESEKIVQEALDRAAQGRTTLVIAHRLSTIRNAHKIIVMHKGQVIEEGDHESLMRLRGTYYSLVEQQNLLKAEEEAQLALELNQSAVPCKTDEAPLGFSRKRASTIVSMTPSVKNALYGKRKSSGTSDDAVDEKTIEVKKPSATFAMLKMNKREWKYIFIGCVSCLCNGGIQPAFGVVLSKLTAVFQECDPEVQKSRVLIYILLFIGFGILMLVTMFLQGFLFACSGEALTKRLRSKAFSSLLRQEIAYFDDQSNNTGALCTRLATEASAVQGATGVRIGLMIQNIAALGTGIILGFVFSWQLTLLILGFVPFMVIGGFLQSRLMTGFASKDKEALEDAGKVSVESIQNIRTVVQLTKENYFHHEYSAYLEVPYRSSVKRAHIFGVFFSLTNSVMFFSLAALFSLGAFLVEQGSISFENLLLCFNCIVFGAQSVGQTASLSPDYTKAVDAAEKILILLNRKPTINNSSQDGDEIPNFHGEFEFDSVHFIYPNRPDAIILRNFQLKIKPGQRVALVGMRTSGCGKSTSVQLIERFYDPNLGRLLVDSKDIRSLNLQWYRSQIGIVSQEPVLFDMSIKENIAYGDNSRDDIPMEEIIAAAQNANIHDFIQTLPQKYETNCGTKGAQLSGGEKQRIAIARALIRNPKILLFDEATSALDANNEKIVQDALDRAQNNRTSITIAHRLSTIQNADLICVLHKGVIVESGTHQELLALQGRYYHLAIGKTILHALNQA
ncbi:unnamed protein product [Rotaria magnacalcarata]|uniref:ATP-binding cassette sub-family B member 5 n=10 Tax=Rotaria magnacalcarata TaxID=392030 RepID=A0A818X809_9BILA|nr:unnamed protein product [Rotaria magnacalcarata]